MKKNNKFDAIFDIPTKAFIIDSEIIDKVLDGTENWEIRSGSNHQRESLALIEEGSGQIVGVANLISIKKTLGYQNKYKNIGRHRAFDERSWYSETWDVIWILENAVPLVTPINFQQSNSLDKWATHLSPDRYHPFKGWYL